jgi:hypothetical protein
LEQQVRHNKGKIKTFSPVHLGNQRFRLMPFSGTVFFRINYSYSDSGRAAMPNNQSESGGWLTEITEHLSGIFRHMLPGILVVAGARLAYPDWFCDVDLASWQHLLVLGAISVAVGNTWFALNRYGLHQAVDYFLYLIKSNGPARRNTLFAFTYLDDLGQYTHKSLHTLDTSERAMEHVKFRASTVLLALTVGELLCFFKFYHAPNSPFEGHPRRMLIGGAVALAVGFWQMVITRRIDYYVVESAIPSTQTQPPGTMS